MTPQTCRAVAVVPFQRDGVLRGFRPQPSYRDPGSTPVLDHNGCVPQDLVQFPLTQTPIPSNVAYVHTHHTTTRTLPLLRCGLPFGYGSLPLPTRLGPSLRYRCCYRFIPVGKLWFPVLIPRYRLPPRFPLTDYLPCSCYGCWFLRSPPHVPIGYLPVIRLRLLHAGFVHIPTTPHTPLPTRVGFPYTGLYTNAHHGTSRARLRNAFCSSFDSVGGLFLFKHRTLFPPTTQHHRLPRTTYPADCPI